MDILNNRLQSSEPASGSSSQRVATASAPLKSGSADGSGAATSNDLPLAGPQIFELLLAQATTGPGADAANSTSSVPAESTSANTSEATARTDLSLFLSLLPNPTTTSNVAPSVSAVSVRAAGEAAMPAVVLAPITLARPSMTKVTAESDGIAVSSSPSVIPALGLSGLLSAAALPEVKRESLQATMLEADGKILAADGSHRMLMSLDHALQPHTVSAPNATIVSASVSGHAALDGLSMTNPEWPTALGHRLMWTLGEGMQKAEIRVTPENLGPIHVHIQIKDDKTDIQFTALHPQAREALETSIPRLREMFAQQGLNLMQAQVFSQTPQDAERRQSSGSESPAANTGVSHVPADTAGNETPQRRGWSLIDDYA